MTPILMTEEAWMNSQFSIARYYGGISIEGHRYIIVDKLGRDLFECSAIAKKEGREKAIAPGEPADLIREDFQRLYKKYGRDKFIAALESNPTISDPKSLAKVLKEGEE